MMMMKLESCAIAAVLLLHLHCQASSPAKEPIETPANVERVDAPASLAAVESAIARGDLGAARRIFRALAVDGNTPEVRDARGAIALADADHVSGQAKLDLLNSVVTRGGKYADKARAKLRTEQLREVEELIDAGRPDDALAAISRIFGDSHDSDTEVDEVRARAHEAIAGLCQETTCTYTEAFQANAWASSPGRAKRAADARAAVLAIISFHEIAGEATLERLRRLRAFGETAAEVANGISADVELRNQASAAQDWAETERGKVPILGSDESIASELLGAFEQQTPKVGSISLGTLRVYLSFDARKICRGIYVVGSNASARALSVSDEALRRVLAQALGRSTTIREATSTTTSSSWNDHGVQIVARWRSGDLMELRLGDAAP
jgi:hypothetical protein